MSSYGQSLKAKLSMPNRKAKIREWRRIYDPLTHHKIVNSLLNDR